MTKPITRTLTLDTALSFNDALEYLLAGKCLGIRPGNNTNYIELYKPGWMHPEGPDWLLRWSRTEDNAGIRSSQYLELWYPVILDHRYLQKMLDEAAT